MSDLRHLFQHAHWPLWVEYADSGRKFCERCIRGGSHTRITPPIFGPTRA